MGRRVRLTDLSDQAQKQVADEIHRQETRETAVKPLQPRSVMNKTETRHAQMLEALKHAGEVIAYRFEAMNFRMADRTYYRPDFFVVTPTCFEVHEIKGGFVRDDALVKWKAVAEMYPWFKWKMYKYHKGQVKVTLYG